VPCWYDFTDC